MAAWIFNSMAQGSGTQGTGTHKISGDQTSGQGGQKEGQHQRPNPAQMAEQLMGKFDANKDSELSQDELMQALEFLRKNHPQGPPGGGQGGDSASASSAGASKGVGQGGHRHGPAGGGGKQQAGQGEQGAGQAEQEGQHQGPPPADKVAAKMIEKFSSDKKGLKQDELAKALEDHMANRGQQGGKGQQGHGGHNGPPSPQDESNSQK